MTSKHCMFCKFCVQVSLVCIRSEGKQHTVKWENSSVQQKGKSKWTNSSNLTVYTNHQKKNARFPLYLFSRENDCLCVEVLWKKTFCNSPIAGCSSGCSSGEEGLRDASVLLLFIMVAQLRAYTNMLESGLASSGVRLCEHKPALKCVEKKLLLAIKAWR